MRPNVIETPTWVTAPFVCWLMMIAPVPQNTIANVPNISAKYLFTDN